MKTVTITLHDTDNCGSSLQSYALQQFLLEHGVENEIIDYVPTYTQNNGHAFRTFVRKIVFFKDSVIRRKKFKKFVADHLHLTKERYTSLEQLREKPPEADCYITGSDQLWNSMYACGRDPAFYLDFTDGKKIAYAVSLGRETIPEDNLEIVRQHTADFSWVSVREGSSVEQLAPFVKCEVTNVCDPVLLNPIGVYNSICVPPLLEDGYILVYVAQKIDGNVLEGYLSALKGTKDVKIVYVGTYRNKCTCDVHIRDMSPGEFLSLIRHAGYVLSNSFHMTLFSMLYQKQFATILPPGNGARIKEMLSRVGLEDHALHPADPLPDDVDSAKYIAVENALRQFSGESGEKLLKVLNKNCTI